MSTQVATKEDVDAIYQENLGRAPDPAGYDAYVGKPIDEVTKAVTSSDEYLSYTTGATVKTVDNNGTTVKVYDNLKLPEGETFTMSHKEGDVFAVPVGTPVSTARNYKKVKSDAQYDYYVNTGDQSGGLGGLVEDVTGIDINKIIPDEVKSGVFFIPGLSDPFGITQGLWGEQYASEGRVSAADMTGLKPEEIQFAQDIGVDVGSLTMAMIGMPYVGAGFKSIKDTSKVTEGQKSTEDLLKDITINYAIAGAIDLMTPSAVTPESAVAPTADTGSFTIGANGEITAVADMPSTFALAETPGVTFFGGAAEIPAVAAPAADAGLTIPTVAKAATDWKEIATIGSLALGAAGLGLSAYGALNQPDQQELLDQKFEQEQQLQQQQFENQMKLQQAQIEASMAMQAEALKPVPSSPAPSTYSGGVKAPTTYKPYGVY